MQKNKICKFNGKQYLQSTNSCTLETQIRLEILGDFPDKTLERQFPDEQLSWFLVPTDLTQGDGAGPAEKHGLGQIHGALAQRLKFLPSSQTKKLHQQKLQQQQQDSPCVYLYLWGFFTPPVDGALFLAALVASCFLGAFPPVDLRAVCLVRAIIYLRMSVVFLRGEKNIQGHYLHSIRYCFQTTRSWIPSAPASTVSVVANKCYKPFSGGVISSYRTLINNTARVGGSLPPFSHVTSPERTEQTPCLVLFFSPPFWVIGTPVQIPATIKLPGTHTLAINFKASTNSRKMAPASQGYTWRRYLQDMRRERNTSIHKCFCNNNKIKSHASVVNFERPRFLNTASTRLGTWIDS